MFTLGTFPTLPPLDGSHSATSFLIFFFFFQCHMFTYKGSVYIELFKRTEEQEHDFSKCHYPLFRKKEVKIISVSKGFRGQKTEGEQLSHTPF